VGKQASGGKVCHLESGLRMLQAFVPQADHIRFFSFLFFAFSLQGCTVNNGIDDILGVVFPGCGGRGDRWLALSSDDITPFLRPIDRGSMFAFQHRLPFTLAVDVHRNNSGGKGAKPH
jgi:hypothetical protein